ncbi:MAG TPA: zinc ribbon domain-containing protein [Polyangiaceae bacterium]|jgi:putative FmdB family regulatory protein
MPTYEYACKACGNAWEASQRISEAPLTECPKCHQQTAERQISGGNFILKGGGWYSDLYSSPSPKKSESATETKSETKTETKSETKTETKSTPAPEKK